MAAITTTSGHRIYFDDTGNGPPLLMIAGFSAARGVWGWQVPAFASHLRVIAIDNRDAGESEPETAPYTIADMASDAIALLDALDIPQASVLGHSMGGFIALRAALDYPERVNRLVLVSTSAAGGPAPARPVTLPDRATWIEDPVERTMRRYAGIAAPGYFDAHPDKLRAVGEWVRGNRLTFEGMARQSQAAQTRPDAHARLPEITAPTLVIHGDADPTIPLRAGEELAGGIPSARLLLMPGVGHVPHLERTAEFNAAVLEFLAAVDD